MTLKITAYDPSLRPFQGDLELRMANYQRTKNKLLKEGETLSDFANGHRYFGFHKTSEGWYYREWAPAA